jgi:AmiR/NasT family two-component response regulator
MSKIIDMAMAIDEEFDKLRYEIESIKCYTHQLEEQMDCQKAKNRDIAIILRELAGRIEREEI